MSSKNLRLFSCVPGAGITRTWELSVFTLKSIKKMLMGLISPKNLSGPITIAKVATASAKSGLESYVSFLALLSVSLAVLNLLPIPPLDGFQAIAPWLQWNIRERLYAMSGQTLWMISMPGSLP